MVNSVVSIRLARYGLKISCGVGRLWLTFYMLVMFIVLYRPLIRFKINFLEIKSGIPSECQTVWMQVRSDRRSVLTFAHTVCKGYQQKTLTDEELKLYIF